ncbi:MAG: hypothetical protein ACKVX7_08450 [Planctomycetota bacterium]
MALFVGPAPRLACTFNFDAVPAILFPSQAFVGFDSEAPDKVFLYDLADGIAALPEPCDAARATFQTLWRGLWFRSPTIWSASRSRSAAS